MPTTYRSRRAARAMLVLACACTACGDNSEGSHTGQMQSGVISVSPPASPIAAPSMNVVLPPSAGTGGSMVPVGSVAGAGDTTMANSDPPTPANTEPPDAGAPPSCEIMAQAQLSAAIPTVGIVTWSTTLPKVETAHIEFGLAETGPTMTVPVDLNEPSYRTLLLGMKAQHDYIYRIVASQGADSCTSQDYMLTTGPLGTSVPTITRELIAKGAESSGFIVTSTGISGGFGGGGFGGGFGGGGFGGGSGTAFIFDTDGDVVWWFEGPASTSRAHMSYDGKDMWMMELNVENGGGEVRRVSMDGMDVEPNVSGLSNGHHDFAVLPDGSVAAAVWLSAGMDVDNALIERAPDGTIKTLVPHISALYNSTSFHPNAIHYYPDDDTFTISDRNPNLFVKITHDGQLLWQFGGLNPVGDYFPGSWQVNHGHQLLDNGDFIFFNNGASGQSTAFEYKLDESSWTATEVWRYTPSRGSGTLGDVQRLANGNTLVTSSNAGLMEEVDPSGNVVQRFTSASFGYADFRESLYGPPSR